MKIQPKNLDHVFRLIEKKNIKSSSSLKHQEIYLVTNRIKRDWSQDLFFFEPKEKLHYFINFSNCCLCASCFYKIIHLSSPISLHCVNFRDEDLSLLFDIFSKYIIYEHKIYFHSFICLQYFRIYPKLNYLLPQMFFCMNSFSIFIWFVVFFCLIVILLLLPSFFFIHFSLCFLSTKSVSSITKPTFSLSLF